MESVLALVNSNASLSGDALNPILLRALSLPNCFFFGELLDNARVARHVGAATSREAHLFSLFCSGTLADYRAAPDRYGAVEGALLDKLKLLTLASLAASEREVPYARLREALELGSDAEVEALVIQAVYAGLVQVRPPPQPPAPFFFAQRHSASPAHTPFLHTRNGCAQGQLDQRAKCVHVQGCAGRDVLPSELPALAGALGALQAAVASAVAVAEEELGGAVAAAEAEAAHKRAYAAKSRAAASASEAREAGSAEAGGKAGGEGAHAMGEESMEDPTRQAKRGRASERAEPEGSSSAAPGAMGE